MEVVLRLNNGSEERVPLVDGAVGFRAFENRNEIVAAGLPPGTFAIGREAYLGCSSLASVKIPEGVTTI